MGGAADSCGTVSRGFQPPPAPQLATRRYERRFANVGLREALMPAGGCLMPRGVGRFPLNLREHSMPIFIGFPQALGDGADRSCAC